MRWRELCHLTRRGICIGIQPRERMTCLHISSLPLSDRVSRFRLPMGSWRLVHGKVSYTGLEILESANEV
jgi:hypothetical protein